MQNDLILVDKNITPIFECIEFNPHYQKEINDFINKSMYKFINRPYKIRKDVADIQNCYLKNGGNFWLAIHNETNHIIGSIGLEKRENIGIVRRFYIQEEYQNQKIGSHLYEICEKYCKENDIKTLYLACGKILEKAHRFYMNHGYQQIDKPEIDMHVGKNDDLFKKIL